MKKEIIILIVSLIIGCSYSVYTTGYPHLKTMKLLPIVNHTNEYDLSDVVLSSLMQQYELDGRLKSVGMSPDCQLECTIMDYSNKIVTYSGATVDEYEVKVLFDVVFTDLKKNEVIWENRSLMLSEAYSSSDENSEFTTEDEAQEEIVVRLFETIMKNTLEEW